MKGKHLLGLVALGSAGAASASVQPDGVEQPESSQLTIRSTRRGDVIVIGSSAADRIQVCSTTLTGPLSQYSIIETLDDDSVVTSTITRTGEFRDFRVDLRAGDDTFSFANCPPGSGPWRARNFTVNGGKGALTYGTETPLWTNEVTGNLSIRASSSADSIQVAGVSVGRLTSVSPAAGDDSISVSGEAGRVSIGSGVGDDTINLSPGVDDAAGFTGLRVFSGGGEDHIVIGAGGYGHNPYINTGHGNDQVTVGPGHHFTGPMQILTSAGEDYLTVQEPGSFDDMGNIVASMGSQRDIAYIEHLIEGDRLSGNTGVDIACTNGGGDLRAFELILPWTEHGCPPFAESRSLADELSN